MKALQEIEQKVFRDDRWDQAQKLLGKLGRQQARELIQAETGRDSCVFGARRVMLAWTSSSFSCFWTRSGSEGMVSKRCQALEELRVAP